MLLKLNLDEATLAELNQAAARELRPLSLQAIVEIRRSLGLQNGGQLQEKIRPLHHPVEAVRD